MDTRTEHDSLGEVQVPREAYWGAQTARAVENYPISRLRPHPALVEQTVRIKLAAARANAALGRLDPRIAGAIERACEEILGGALADQFVVDPYQAGAGTSHHMNVNEVIAARASELLGGPRSPSRGKVHPNDHVNLGQSTNDVFPTAMRLAAHRLALDLAFALEELHAALAEKSAETMEVIKSGRTHLQDAAPIRLGREIGAWATNVRRHREAILQAAAALGEIGIGGTAVGTGLSAAPGYRERMVQDLAEQTGLPLRPADDLYEAMQSIRPIAALSSAIRNLAADLFRITADIRLLASGPLTGLGELKLPAVQPGSSIMPGKVNPSIPEMLAQVCVRVIGGDATIGLCAASGQLELNVFFPVAAHTILEMETLLANAVRVFTARCVRGLQADAERCATYAARSQQLVLALLPLVGYERAGQVAKRALENRRTIVDEVIAEGLLPEEEARRRLDPAHMAGE
ncbi:MAG TPA: aspartate ammonia-lyase [Fredinandcohnia sp.]|nr:aspartate ammonia-lyase [Fredinandcohnia sp.]